VLTLGLAIAANTALFSVFDGLLFRPLPFADADRIVHLRHDLARLGGMSRAERSRVVARAAETPSLVHRAAAGPATLFDPAGAAVADWGVRAYSVSPSIFTLLGVEPALGRRFTAEDKAVRHAVLLGHDLWRARFGADPMIVGTRIDIPNTAPDRRWQIIGVMPEGFSFPEGANFWVADDVEPSLLPYARLAPTASIEQVRAELPELVVTSLREHVQPDGAFALGVLVAATALMLLVAWVQVAALLFTRATGRVAQIGVRLALGATRLRLIRQFGLEAAVLAALALGLAALAAPALTAWIVRVLPPELTVGQAVDPDIRAFLFAGALSAVGLLLLAILPIDLIRRTSPVRLLRGGVAGELGIRATRVRRALFVGQLTLGTALVYLTSLAATSFVNVTAQPLGFSIDSLYAIRVPRGDDVFLGAARDRQDQRRATVTATIELLRGLPGVRAVAGANAWPMRRDSLDAETLTTDKDPDRTSIVARRVSVGPGYAATIGIPVLTGAEPTEAALDTIRSVRDQWPALVNRSLARNLESFGPVVGQVLSGRWKIVGTLPDVRLERPDRPAEPTVFLYLPPIAAVNGILVRLESGRTPEEIGVVAVLQRLWGTSPPRPFPVSDAVHLATGEYRARVLLLGLVAILTIPLTLLGVAGALTYAVRQHARETAIELAIGAEPRGIRRRVVRDALVAAAQAAGVGLVVGAALGAAASSALFGVRGIEPLWATASVSLTIAVAWLAALVPAHRAGRTSPAQMLREP
jgi:putative ABC transport system permease protein